ncbi:MAG: O-antigen biosynthesis glycosyltransferase WbnI [Chlamydiae bacterium]|nr:O-antigen biosynthesis glycosyltransferase WbnI [Chlamydiota bacterium]
MFVKQITILLVFLSLLVGCKKPGCPSCPSKKKVGLCVVATGKYDFYARDMINSARSYFLKDCDVTYFVFTDGEIPPSDDVVIIPQEHLGWPGAALKRFHMYDEANRNLFSDMDYLFAIDADMRFVRPVGEEILGRITAVSRDVGKHRTYERKKKSTAYVKKKRAKHYFAGAFYGGKRREFFKMVHRLKKRVDKDLSWGYIAVWHDESYLNRYLLDHPPQVYLDTSYCYLEKVAPDYIPKIIALDKTK